MLRDTVSSRLTDPSAEPLSTTITSRGRTACEARESRQRLNNSSLFQFTTTTDTWSSGALSTSCCIIIVVERVFAFYALRRGDFTERKIAQRPEPRAGRSANEDPPKVSGCTRIQSL